MANGQQTDSIAEKSLYSMGNRRPKQKLQYGPQTVEESINLLQSLLAAQIPGWTATHKDFLGTTKDMILGDLADPENVRNQATVLDSLLYEATGGHPPYIQLFKEDEWYDYVDRKSKGRSRKWWGAEARTGKKTLYSDPSEATPDTLRGRSLRDIIAEIPHSLQFRDPNWLKSREDYWWGDNGRSFGKDWKKKYTTPGAYEHEAHSIIQPLIENLFFKGKFTDSLKYPEEYERNLLEGPLRRERAKEIADKRSRRLAKEKAEGPKFGLDGAYINKNDTKDLHRVVATTKPDLYKEYKIMLGEDERGESLIPWLERNYPQFREDYKLLREQNYQWQIDEQQRIKNHNTGVPSKSSVPQGTNIKTYYK